MSSWARVLATVLLLCALSACSGTSSPVSLAGDAQSSTDASQRATALLDRVYVPGAVRLPASRSAQVQVLEQNQVQERRSFTVLGRASTIIAALEAEPPSGLETVQPPFVSTATSAPLPTVVAELKPVGHPGSSMQTVSIAATDLGGGRVGLNVQAAVGWVGARTAVETITGAVTDVQLAIGFADQPDEAMNRNTQMTTEQVHELGALLNALPPAARDQYEECTQPDTALAPLTLSYGGHQATFDIQIGACDEVDVTVDGFPQPLLGHDQAVSQEVAAILHMTLPPV